MKVPSIGTAIPVTHGGDSWIVDTVDFRNHTAIIKRFEGGHCIDKTIPFTEYEPAPTWGNFTKAIDQWDYYYRMSESPVRLDEGYEMAKALKEFFKQLPVEDQHRIQKIVDIVVSV